MEFTCTYCEKPISGISIILDKTHFLHQGCEEAFKSRKTTIDYLKDKLEEKEAIQDAFKKGTLSSLIKKRNIKIVKPI